MVNSSRYGFQIDIVGSSEDFFVEKAAVCTYLTFFLYKTVSSNMAYASPIKC